MYPASKSYRIAVVHPDGHKNAVFAGIAFLLGFVGLVLVFSDPAEGWRLRMIIGSAFFLLSSGAIGYLHPDRWPIAVLTAWGGVLFGGLLILLAIARYGRDAFNAAEPPYITSGLIILFGSLGSAFFGGLLGRSLSGHGFSQGGKVLDRPSA
ncbi:MAG TPA: hypothetical protein PKD26_08110 [Pyrinomonadaceae bacterium]|nr:hypothetical protein [Pyrinomonadaceae bacterium]